MKPPAGRKRASRALRQDEHSLWKTIIRSVAPLRRGRPAEPEPKAAAEKSEKREPAIPRRPAAPPPTAAVPAPARKGAPPLAPLGRRLRQRLARGSEPIDRRIDLHGLTQDEAHNALARFLRAAQAAGVRNVLVVTGKGGRGNDRDPYAERGVLKRMVPQWLRQAEFRGYVLGFESAHSGHGGEGALYLRLRRKRVTE